MLTKRKMLLGSKGIHPSWSSLKFQGCYQTISAFPHFLLLLPEFVPFLQCPSCRSLFTASTRNRTTDHKPSIQTHHDSKPQQGSSQADPFLLAIRQRKSCTSRISTNNDIPSLTPGPPTRFIQNPITIPSFIKGLVHSVRHILELRLPIGGDDVVVVGVGRSLTTKMAREPILLAIP